MKESKLLEIGKIYGLTDFEEVIEKFINENTPNSRVRVGMIEIASYLTLFCVILYIYISQNSKALIFVYILMGIIATITSVRMSSKSSLKKKQKIYFREEILKKSQNELVLIYVSLFLANKIDGVDSYFAQEGKKLVKAEEILMELVEMSTNALSEFREKQQTPTKVILDMANMAASFSGFVEDMLKVFYETESEINMLLKNAFGFESADDKIFILRNKNDHLKLLHAIEIRMDIKDTLAKIIARIEQLKSVFEKMRSEIKERISREQEVDPKLLRLKESLMNRFL